MCFDSYSDLSVLRCQMQGSVGVQVPEVNVDLLCLEQHLGYLGPSILSRQVQSRVLVVVARVHVRTLQQQRLNDARTTILR